MGETTLLEQDATSLRALIRDGEVSPVEIVEATIERIEAMDDMINAFVTTDFEGARAAARKAERTVAGRETSPPLQGICFTAKDLIFTAGVRTTGGSELYRDFVPEVDDIAVTRLRQAGAILVGKTNLAEFGYGGFTDNRINGLTRNPLDLDRTPGGSTGGGAAAVAAGMGPLALGTDGGGSIRTPATFCGLVGFKPTFGAIPMHPSGRDPRYPGFSGWEEVEHQGPIARSVSDVALAFDALAGASPLDRHSVDVDPWGDPDVGRSVRVAWTPDWGYAQVDPAVASAFEKAILALSELPRWHLEEESLAFADPSEAFWPIVASDTDALGLRRVARSTGGQLTDYLAQAVNSTFTFDDLRAAHLVRQTVVERLRTLFERADMLITPAVAVPAWTAGEREPTSINGRAVHPMAWTAFTFPMNLAGLPAITVPCGALADGSRVSIQIAARRGADRRLLQVAAAAERALEPLVPKLTLDPRLKTSSGS